MGVAHQAQGLTQDGQGIWFSADSEPVSYPTAGNELYASLEERSFWFAHRNECISALVARHPPQGQVLDIGGGNGFVTRRLIDDGLDASLLEPGPAGARNARLHRHIPEVICATLDGANFRQGSLDAACCFDVIEHVEDDHAFLTRLHGLLRPGGILYATVPAHQALWSQADDSAGHHRRYTRRTLRSRLRAAHFEPLFLSYYFAALVLPIAALRALPYRVGLTRGSALSDEAEHGSDSAVTTALLQRALSWETQRIHQGKPIPLGASLLVAARRNSD